MQVQGADLDSCDSEVCAEKKKCLHSPSLIIAETQSSEGPHRRMTCILFHADTQQTCMLTERKCLNSLTAA